MIGPASRPQRSERVLVQQASGTQVLLHVESGEYYALNDIGVRVWDLCDGTRCVADIATILSQEYEADVATIEADILELLQDLADEHLVVEGDATPGGAPASPSSE